MHICYVLNFFAVLYCIHSKRYYPLPLNTALSITITLCNHFVSCLLLTGNACTPQVFFNDVLIGGASELQSLEDKGELETMLKACLEGPVVEFPPPLREPTGQEFMNVRMCVSI